MKVLIPQQEIELEVRDLCNQIDMTDIFMIGVRDGAMPFMGLLINNMWDRIIAKETITAKSYVGTCSTGDVKITPDFNLNTIKNKNILLVDDIFDTGQTLERILYVLKCYEPAQLQTIVLLSKNKVRYNKVSVDYSVFEIEDKFVVGFGMDYDGKFRNLPDICEIS